MDLQHICTVSQSSKCCMVCNLKPKYIKHLPEIDLTLMSLQLLSFNSPCYPVIKLTASRLVILDFFNS